MLWTPKRLPGKHLSCVIATSRPDEFASIVYDDEPMSAPVYVVRPAYVPMAHAGGRVYVTTDPHGCPDELPAHWHRMRQGVKSGLSDDTGALSGKHVLHQAISLAVHLGFSTIRLQVPDPEPRLRRALDSLVRPLRHRRVTVTGCAPFPEE